MISLPMVILFTNFQVGESGWGRCLPRGHSHLQHVPQKVPVATHAGVVHAAGGGAWEHGPCPRLGAQQEAGD
jgi:hypothetical protein